MSEKNIWSDAYKREDMMDLRFDLTQLRLDKKEDIPASLTAVQFEHGQDREVVEEAAVQYEGYQRSQSALSSWSCGFGAVGIQLTENFRQEKHNIKAKANLKDKSGGI